MTTFTLKPLANLRDTEDEEYDWLAIYDDPQFWVENWRDFVGCTLSITCVIKSKHHIKFPLVIYYDVGRDYSERTATYLEFYNQVAKGVVEIPLDAKAIRFDPFMQTTLFSIEELSVEIIGYTEGKDQHLAQKIMLGGLPNIQPPYAEAYNDWLNLYDPPEGVYPTLKRESDAWETRPCISILMPTYNFVEEYFRQALQSLQGQVYDNWRLCIADDCSTDPKVKAIIEEYRQADPRISVVYRTENGHISEASNSALALVQTEYVGLMDHDDKLHPLALYFVAEQINLTPDMAIIYSDEDKINDQGLRTDAYFKPGFNYDLYLCQNMISHFGVYKTEVLNAIGGFRKGFEGSQDYDLALRALDYAGFDKIVHIPRVLYHWRLHEESTSQDNDAKPYAKISALASVKEHLSSRNIAVELEEDCFMSVHGKKLTYQVDQSQNSVEIIIPSKDNAAVLQTCVDSIIEKTSYQNYRITIVDNGSTEPAALSLLAEYQAQANISVIKHDQPFNFSALNNLVALESEADLVCFLNNDTEVITADWLTEMVSLAIQPKVGCVGAKLYYPDDTIQHAGIVLGFGGIAGHPHKRNSKEDIGYYGRAGMRSEFTAVTAACMVIEQPLFKSLGGFDENLAVAFNDIDLCLQLRVAGHRVVFTPYAELYHHESYSRGYDDQGTKKARIEKESDYLKAKWGETLARDAFYSPNHGLLDDEKSFQLAHPPRIQLMKEVNDH